MSNSRTFPWLSRSFSRKSRTFSINRKPERFFQNKLYYLALLNWLILTVKNNQWQVTLEKNPWTGHFGQKALRSRGICFTTLSYQKYFNKQHVFIIFGNKEDFLHIPGFSRTTIQIQGLSRAWKFFPQIPGLSRIFKDLGNPELLKPAFSRIWYQKSN